MARTFESVGTTDADLADTRLQILKRDASLKREALYRRVWVLTLPIFVIPIAIAVGVNSGTDTIQGTIPTTISYVTTGAISVLIAIFWTRKIIKSRLRSLKLREEREELREAQRSLIADRIADEDEDSDQKQTLASLRQYRHSTWDQIEEYRAGAKHYRRIGNWLQMIIIIGSILTTGVTSAAGQFPQAQAAAPFISIIVGVSAGIIGYFKFKERSLNLQQAADAIEHEYNAVELRIRRYRGKSNDLEALAEFAEEVERIKEEQSKREQQLEQPPELHGRPQEQGTTTQ